MVSITGAARALGVNRTTIHRWIQEGKLHAVTVGRTRLIQRREVQRLLDRRRRALLTQLAEQSIDLADDVQVRLEVGGDPKEFRLCYVESGGGELVGVGRFGEDPVEWLEKARLRRGKRGVSANTA